MEHPVLDTKLMEFGVDISYVTAVMFIPRRVCYQGDARGNWCITGRA